MIDLTTYHLAILKLHLTNLRRPAQEHYQARKPQRRHSAPAVHRLIGKVVRQ